MLPTDPDYLHDVAIVGFGPTGALLANLLGRAGRSVLVAAAAKAAVVTA